MDKPITNPDFRKIGRICIGGISHDTLIGEAISRGIEITPGGMEVFKRSTHSPHRVLVDVIGACVRIHLPKKSDEKTLRAMYLEGFEEGFCLCPPAISLCALMELPPGSLGEVELAMNPILCPMYIGNNLQEDVISIFDKPGCKRIISTVPGYIDDRADGGYEKLFCVWTPELAAAGWARGLS